MNTRTAWTIAILIGAITGAWYWLLTGWAWQ